MSAISRQFFSHTRDRSACSALSAFLVFGMILLCSGAAHADAVRAIPGLVSISFWERTGGTGPSEFVFAVDGSELTTRLADPLGPGNFDISGAFSEYYDVYYSDQEGTFNLDGEYLSIEGVFLQSLPAGGGLNLAEIGLNFDGEATEFGNFVASFVALGDNAVPEIVGRAIDGDLLTHTSMGNTIGSDQRLRVTLGFESSSGPIVPIPAAAWLFGSALGLLARLRRR
jgi:hypothetical protein